MTTAKDHNSRLTGSTELFPAKPLGSANNLAKPPSYIPDLIRKAIAEACTKLNREMWKRENREPTPIEFGIVIDRAIEEFSR